MLSIYMCIAVLAATAVAKGSIECVFSESTGPRRCFGAVGQPLIFHLSDKANTEITLLKDGTNRILKKDKNGTVRRYEEFGNQSEHINNGTFKLGNATKRHSGDYLLEEYSADGKLLNTVTRHLEIQAPVSKPTVSQTCSSPEQMKVSCSCEGDEVQFSLTLDGQLLIKTGAHSQSPSNWTAEKSSVSNVTISLHGQLTGELTCQIWNNVSRDETARQLAACKGSVSTLPAVAVAAIASVVTFFLLLPLSLVIINLHRKPRLTTVHEGNFEDEIVYTDVSVTSNTRKNRPHSHHNPT